MARMEQTMAKPIGLNTSQLQTLTAIATEPYFLETFYLSGGTALASWYLFHRESYDLDFFSERPFDYEKIRRWFHQQEKELGYSTIRFDDDYGFLICYLRYQDTSILKVDFNNYADTRLKSSLQWKGLSIDSEYDICVNKVRTIAVSPRTRDYVDLYFILKVKKYSLNDILNDVKVKFHEELDLLQLAHNFLNVEQTTDLPIMLKPFEKNDMVKFFQKLSDSLKTSIFR